ncbi:hypothetical protein [Sphingomonas pituitosa]|uniref:hypothetical protein n=1 Tax=Sphingomonas pituitosa TaxID=99597 RepID=UPI000A7ECCE5|nr:hypothetical protein [Sphingomonas pituitosa]
MSDVAELKKDELVENAAVTHVNIKSRRFPNVFLRLDGSGVNTTSPNGAGVVNGQYNAGPYEKFILSDNRDGTVSFESAQFKNVFLRMDGRGVVGFSGSGGGVVNCQYTAMEYERFRLVLNADLSASIESVQFDKVFLRLDGSSVKAPTAPGGGVVNCQYGVGEYEKFVIVQAS